MKKLIALSVILVALMTASTAGAAHHPMYRTDAAANNYLEHSLRSWAGINLHIVDLKIAICFNGYYSRHETRTHHHYKQGLMNKAGENIFHSFGCSFVVNTRTFNLYLLAVRTGIGWTVQVDR